MTRITTMTLRIAICDDDQIFTDNFLKMLRGINISSYTLETETYSSGNELLDSPCDFDLIFLDIKLNDSADGIDIASILRDRNYKGYIVFLTNYPDYMPMAFSVYAFRFLLKPIAEKDLVSLISDIKSDLYKNKKITFPTVGGHSSVWLDDILYIESHHNSTYMFTRQNEIKTRTPINDWVKLLSNDHFVRCHRSYIVSLRYIETILPNGIRLSEASPLIPVARNRLTEEKDAYFKYLKENSLTH